jgi:hypothetical protein
MNNTIMTILDVISKQLRKSQKKTLAVIIESLLQGSQASLADIARGMGRKTKFGSRLKRVWRYACNANIDPAKAGADLLGWFISRLGIGEPLVLLVDWSKFYGNHVLVAAVPLRKRAIPVLWEIVSDDDLSRGRNTIEYEFFNKLRGIVSQSIPVIIVADRGFGRVELFVRLNKLGLGYIIRVKDAVWVGSESWQGVLADYPIRLGQIIQWENIEYQKNRKHKLSLVMRNDITRSQASAWYLATNVPREAVYLLKRYESRMWIEEMFRDLKSSNFKLDSLRLKNPTRRSRLMIAISLATLIASVIGLNYISKSDYSFVEANGRRNYMGFSIFRVGMNVLKHLGDAILKTVWLPLLKPLT